MSRRPVDSHHTSEPLAKSAAPTGDLQFQRLLEKLPAGAYTCDPEGLITYYNPQAVELWGRAPKLCDHQDRYCGSFRLFATDGTPIRHDQCWMALALKARTSYNGREIIVQRPDGTQITAMAYANPLLDDSGNLTGAVNVLVNVSQLKEAEAALKEANRSKDEFLATLAHELRNPLAPIRNASEILRRQLQPTEEVEWALGIIDRQMQQMTRLIDDLLDVSRITRGKLQLHKERVSLTEVVQRAVETVRPVIETGRHELFITLPADPLEVDADATRLAQAISNLLNNAAKYTPTAGKIWLQAERQEDLVVLTVRDTGIGIPPDMLQRIFEMFTQVDHSLERAQGGLGIGLTLVKRLVEMHGGTVEARSDGLGQGSEFALRIPLAPADAASQQALSLGPPQAAISSALRIMVVDDNRDAATSLALLLRAMGNDVRTAFDGQEALQLADTFQPQVAICDIGLPKLNGYDLARSIRTRPWSVNCTLIALTGWGQDEDRQRALEASYDHHMVKPVVPAELMAFIAKLRNPSA